ncbi:hypothetical protein RM479_04420 [Nocardiopsis sp. DSM 44743]|uniref:Uncharacterized protein n=2 Tax=Nocardiopsis lambiniae TaxID=3075539 RepID=A0ABU2M6N2_9ACTN|nr:hypothetical protein [Nocardiopsis sp. DSM 44743]MDT0327651.1 hypothetical protein [Nocardiopsis sp. DSM 44743]
MVVPLTRTRRESPPRVEVEPDSSGLKDTGHARREDLRAVAPLRPERLSGAAEDTALFRVDPLPRRLPALRKVTGPGASGRPSSVRPCDGPGPG